MTVLAATRNLIFRTVEAARGAWWEDKLFRSAVIGMGVTLAVVLVRPGPSQNRSLLPLDNNTSAGVFAVPNLPGGNLPLPTQTQTLPAPVPTIAPGHALGDVTLTPAPDNNGDRFGTLKLGHHP